MVDTCEQSPLIRGVSSRIGPRKDGVFDDIEKIRTALSEKAKRYRDVDSLVIALRGYPWPLDRLNEAPIREDWCLMCLHLKTRHTLALFIRRLASVSSWMAYWGSSSGSQNEHVIGVLKFNEVYPQSVSRATCCVLRNTHMSKNFRRLGPAQSRTLSMTTVLAEWKLSKGSRPTPLSQTMSLSPTSNGRTNSEVVVQRK